MLSIGIVGLPNVGKSTLFNALTSSRQADAQNFPFCTIEPNTGIVSVPDVRLDTLSDLIHPEKTIPAAIEFIDIAGLVSGASQGEGLGNTFLSHIRECDAICQVVRKFADDRVIHVSNRVDPKSDIDIINTELLLADLETVQKRIQKTFSKTKSGDKDAKIEIEFLEELKKNLEQGILVHNLSFTPEQQSIVRSLHLITAKPFLYLLNISDGMSFTEDYHAELGLASHYTIVPVNIRIEQELSELDTEDKQMFMAEYGMEEESLPRLIRASFQTLHLETYFTAGEKEVRAWTIPHGSSAPQAAGVIHTDFEKGFIKAETIAYADFIECKGWNGGKEKGKVRQEGKEYIVQDGDVLFFKFSS